MVITNNKKIFEEVKKLKPLVSILKLKIEKNKAYQVSKLGFNYRMTDFQAALGYFQIKNYRNNLKKDTKLLNCILNI